MSADPLPPAPAALPELKAKMLRLFREAGLRSVPIEQIPDLIEEIARMTWAEADTEKAALAQRVAELEAELDWYRSKPSIRGLYIAAQQMQTVTAEAASRRPRGDE